PGPRGAPAEPEERPWHQLGHDLLLRRPVHGGREGPVHEVEEVEQADPDDAGDDVDPAEDRLENVSRVHRPPSLARTPLASLLRRDLRRETYQRDRSSSIPGRSAAAPARRALL